MAPISAYEFTNSRVSTQCTLNTPVFCPADGDHGKGMEF